MFAFFEGCVALHHQADVAFAWIYLCFQLVVVLIAFGVCALYISLVHLLGYQHLDAGPLHHTMECDVVTMHRLPQRYESLSWMVKPCFVVLFGLAKLVISVLKLSTQPYSS
jgi:hypothetical protein